MTRPDRRRRACVPEVGSLESRLLLAAPHLDLGSPVLVDVWIDPVHGSDSGTGASRDTALRSVTAAWDRIPAGPTLGTGYRLNLLPGTYTDAQFPLWMEGRRGTAGAPVILQAADGPGTVQVPEFQIHACSYVDLIGVSAQGGGDDVLHISASDHILLRGVALRGTGSGYERPQESLKVNQTQYLYVEDCDISGAWGNALDCVAVQHGWVVDSRIHDAEDWVMYLKGGSAYLHVEGNEIYGGGTGGFSAGQGTGLEYMVAPWLNYECYGITVMNNVIHDTEGAGLGVNGSYSVLMAGNTVYRVGARSHAVEVVQGARSCDGDVARCQQNLALGGWGVSQPGAGGQFIPNRNVYIYNNIVYNPAGYQSAWQQFDFAGPVMPPAGSNLPSPARADDNLQIRGNLIWNGPADLPLGIGDGSGCQPSNPTCNETLLRRDNVINAFEPQLVDPAHGDFRPVRGGNVYGVTTFAVPAFSWADAPARPAIPAGETDQGFIRDRAGSARTSGSPPGAYVGTDGPVHPPTPPVPPATVTAADLAATAVLTPSSTVIRGRSTYVLGVVNRGTAAATNVAINVTIPGGLKVLMARASVGLLRRRGSTYVLTLARLEAGASVQLTLGLQALRVGTFLIRSTCASASAEANPADNGSIAVLAATAARSRRR